MREIKFRAWGIDRGKMHDIYNIAFHESYGYKAITNEQPLNVNTTFINKEEFILMQFTGLKDKNGKEIYEGDVVENGNEKVGYVVFLIQEAGFVVALKDRDYRLGHRNTGEGYIMADNHKVIGNIYENPELLETN